MVGAPGPGEITRYHVDGPPQPLTVGEGAAWVSVGSEGVVSLWRIDARTGQVMDLPEIRGAVWVAAGEGAAWATCNAKVCGGRAVLRLDPSSGSIFQTVPLPAHVWQITVGLGAVWVTTDDGLVKIDPSTEVATTVSTGGFDLVGTGGDGIWVSTTRTAGLFRIDPGTGTITATVSFPDPCTMDATDRVVFVASCDGGAHAGVGHDELMALDARTGEILYRVPLEMNGQMREANGILWVAGNDPVQSEFIRILRLDPSTGAPVADPVEVRRGPVRYSTKSMFAPHVFFATGEDSLWVTDFGSGEVIRLGLPVAASQPDPRCLSKDDPRYIGCEQALEVAARESGRGDISKATAKLVTRSSPTSGTPLTMWEVTYHGVLIVPHGRESGCLIGDWVVTIDAKTGRYMAEGTNAVQTPAACPTLASPTVDMG
jgi:hypothetical protein